MGKYMFEAKYTADGAKAVAKDGGIVAPRSRRKVGRERRRPRSSRSISPSAASTHT